MIDHRHETKVVRIGRFLWFAVGAVIAIVFFKNAAELYGAPSSAIWRYREPSAPPHVFVRGTLRRETGATLPAICSVVHQRYEQCGKSRCWKWFEGMNSSHATLDVEWSSSPLPKSVPLASSFQFDPRPPEHVIVDRERSDAWKKIAQGAHLGFTDQSLASSSTDRIVEDCLDEGERVYLEACVSTSVPAQLEACPGLTFYGVVAGEPQSAIDAAADDIALRVAGGFFALLVGVLAMVRPSGRLAEGLEDRAAPHRRRLGWAWALLAVPPIAGLVTLLLHASRPPSTWATGRGGFALGISVLALWVLFALGRLLHRNRTLAALGPILATPRSLLADANGTVELAVRARPRGDGVRTLIGAEHVAFAEARIVETYKAGKNTSSIERLVYRANDELEIVDESGDGVLHLGRGILDVELRKVTLTDLSPRYAERGIVVDRHPNHLKYVVEERIIRDGESLYVYGDVSGIELKSNEQLGYRSVRGAPKLGGSDVAPVLVYAGDERGLVAMLTTHARAANSLAVVAGFVACSLAAALAYCASL